MSEKIGRREFAKEDWYEDELPKPPIPSLERTFERYLQYASVVAESAPELALSLDDTNMAVSRFFPVAEKLQDQLRSIAAEQDNWVNEFWLSEMYLKQRPLLPVNFNPAYVFAPQNFQDENDQLDYAAWMVRGLMEYKDKIDKRQLPRDVNRGRVNAKMCMTQYDRILDCYREPSFGMDIQHYRRRAPQDYGDPDQEYILVMCDRQMFIVFTRLLGVLLSQFEILDQLKKVADIAANRYQDTVLPIGAATVGNRDDAARFWLVMKEESINVNSLNWVQSATFVLCLDRNEGPLSMQTQGNDYGPDFETAGLHILHGFGSSSCGLNRWFDATIQLIVSRTGYCGLCIEHSVAEGIVIINMVENALRLTYERRAFSKKNISEEKTHPLTNLRPKPLSWVLNEDSQRILQREIADFDKLVDEVQLRVLFFDDFGKTVIKSLLVSPDGFVQLSMQLAHYRMHGCLVSTYESATMRKFRFGRVDNIRAATPEAFDWVRAMDNPHVDRNRKISLFQKAADKQSLVTQENVNGEGIDNHLCALEVLAKKAVDSGGLKEIPELFRENMWTEVMRFPLSTSQVTTSPEFKNYYLFYGPVVEDGYGCAYNIQNDRLIFAASAFKSNARTHADGFRTSLTHALRDMHSLLSA